MVNENMTTGQPRIMTWNAIAEARYTWSDDDLTGDFAGLGTLDLGGLAVYAGFGFRF